MLWIVVVALWTVLAIPAEATDGPAVTLRVGVPPGPDAVAGFDRGLFAEVARDAGLGVVFEVLPPADALAALDEGRLDVAAGPFPPPQAPGRRALAAVAVDGDGLLKRRGDGSLAASGDAAGKVVGLLAAPAGAARLRAEAAALGARVAARRSAFPDPLGDLAAGRVAALIGGLPDIASAALDRPDADEVVGPILGRPVPLVPVVRADRPGLAATLDEVLARMTADGRLADVQRRWFGFALDGPPVDQRTPGSMRDSTLSRLTK